MNVTALSCQQVDESMRHVNVSIANWLKTRHPVTTPAPTMALANLAPADLALSISPAALGFKDTFELVQQPLPWIGQARAETAARFGLTMDQPD